MKTIRQAILGTVVLLFASVIHSIAITNTTITVSSGTNIVLYWPSYGYETYLIQYRQTLSATDSWSQLTNDYYANGTNFTTYAIYGVVPRPASGGSGGGGSGTNPPPPEPMVEPANGSGNAVPLALYPPGFDLTGFNIFDPATGEWMSGNGETVSTAFDSSLIASGAAPMGGRFSPDDTTNDVSGPQTGFFRVFHIPDWLANFSGYTFDGPTFIPVDFAAPDAPIGYVDNTTVLVNGQPFNGATLIPYDIDDTSYWGMGIYFDLLPNGTNTIQLLTTIRESDTLSDQTPYMVFSNAPQTIVIGNFVTYTNWEDFIWNSSNYTFTAQSSTPDVNWEIDIYDVNGYFVNSQTGFSADGNISWTWNLTDYTGASRLDDGDPFFYPYITITNSSGDPGGPMPTFANSFPSTGGWIITYMDNFYLDAGSNYSGYDAQYKSAMSQQMPGGPAEWSIPVADFPVNFGTNYTQTQRNQSWTNLMSALEQPQYRNLYYYGHGAPDTIGGDEVTFVDNVPYGLTVPGSGALLTSEWVKDNVTYSASGQIRYRFVFLDGCNTANGGWPAAWGVPRQGEGLDYYTSTNTNPDHVRPSAFVGWNVSPGGPNWGTVDKAIGYRAYWMSTWAGSEQETLLQSFQDANSDINWVSQGQIIGNLVVDGYQGLQFRQYEYGGDWP